MSFEKNINNKIFVFVFFLLFFLIGILIFSDYGISIDEDNSRTNGFVSLKYIYDLFLPNQVEAIEKIITVPNINSYNEQGIGVVFDLPISFLELILKIEDTRHYYLLRHFFNFSIFFISIYFFFRIVSYRYNSWIIGLLGSLFLIISPRIFAESFYNPKDIIFMSFFIIALFYSLKFLEKPNITNAFLFSLTCSLAIDIRILGIILPVIIIFFYFIKILRDERYKKNSYKILILLLVIFPLFIVLFWPYLWENPISTFTNVFKSMSFFDASNIYNFYLGEYVSAKTIPWHYPVIWLLITIPIFYIILFLIGSISILFRLLKRLFKIEENNSYNDLWRGNAELQDFIFLLTFFIPLFMVIILNSSLYDGWRHLYFIYPSFLLISLKGLSLLRIIFFKKKEKILIILTVLLLIPTITWMIKYHPYQYVYFNSLANKNFNKKFEMDYWGVTNYDALMFIIKNVNVNVKVANLSSSDLELSKSFIDKNLRDKILITSDLSNSDFIVNSYRNRQLQDEKINLLLNENFKVFYEIKIGQVPINTIYQKIR